MLATRQYSETPTIYLQIKASRICQTSKKEQDGWEKRITQNPHTKEDVLKYYKFYDSVEGIITSVEWYEKDGNPPFKGYKVYLKDGDERYCLDLSASDYRVMTKFLLVAENIDFSEPVKFTAWESIVKDADGNPKIKADGNKQTETAFVLYQNGKVVQRKYTKDNPGDLPQPKFNKKLNKWDFNDYTTALYEKMDTLISEKFAAKTEQNVAEDGTEKDDEDIPF